MLLKHSAVLWRVTFVEIRAVEYTSLSPVIGLIKPSVGLPCLLINSWDPSTTIWPGSQNATEAICEVIFVVARFPFLKYKLGPLIWFGLGKAVASGTPVEILITWEPAGLGGRCVPIPLTFTIGTSLQNSREDTKNPSKGPFWHSYLLTLVG